MTMLVKCDHCGATEPTDRGSDLAGWHVSHDIHSQVYDTFCSPHCVAAHIMPYGVSVVDTDSLLDVLRVLETVGTAESVYVSNGLKNSMLGLNV